MLCVFEVLSLVYGIMTLVRGKFALGKTKEVRGAPAYVIGVVLLATIPVAVVLAIIMNFDDIMKGNQQGFQFGKLEAKTILPDLIAVVGCWGTAFLIAFVKAEPKVDDRPRGRRFRDDEYDDYEPGPRGRGRRYADDEEEDDRPRRRRYDDDDRDRPRRGDDLDERAR
jgi:hypothetical protein